MGWDPRPGTYNPRSRTQNPQELGLKIKIHDPGNGMQDLDPGSTTHPQDLTSVL